MAETGNIIAGQVLGAIRNELQQKIVPHLANDDALHSVRMMDDILAYMSGWLEKSGDIIEAVTPSFRALDVSDETPELIDDFLLIPDSLGKIRGELQHAVEQDTGPVDKQILASEGQYFRNEADVIKNVGEAVAQRLDDSEVIVTPLLATHFLESTLGQGHRVEAVSRAPGGYSKDTLFFSAINPDGVPLPLVIRRDLPFGPGETTVVEEYRILEALAAHDFPIARPLILDASAILGQPAMVSEHVTGKSGTEEWASDPVKRDKICKTLARAVARLHRFDPSDLSLIQEYRDPREVVRDYIVEWQDRWQRYRLHPCPSLAVAYAWLLANIPARIDRVSIVHGDIGFHNTMVEQDRLVALLDWEFAHLGDAAEDISYCRPFLKEIGGWKIFIQCYRDAGGPEYHEENARFFNVWRSVRNATSCATAWRGFVNGRYPALKMIHQGIPLYRRFTREVISALENAT